MIQLAQLEAQLHALLPKQSAEPQESAVTIMNQAEELAAANDVRRGHLGYSKIGEQDARTIWLEFRWCLPEDRTPRMRRLLRLGHILERDVFRALQSEPMRGTVKVLTENPKTGKQYHFSDLGGHFAGSCDGIGFGFPEVPDKDWCVLEIKSAKADRWRQFEKFGIKHVAPEYWSQAQCYCEKAGVKYCLFIVYNKDTSEIYSEVVTKKDHLYSGYMVKAESIIASDRPPESVYFGRDDYRIKNFKSRDYQSVYWGERLPDEQNCRNCARSRPDMERPGANWVCDLYQIDIPYANQLKGCTEHAWLPALVPLEFLREDPTGFHYKLEDGTEIVNCPAGEEYKARHFASPEFSALSKVGFRADFVNDEFAAGLRETFGATLLDAELLETTKENEANESTN